MMVGLLTVRLEADWSRSLKDKRSVVKSLRDRIRHKFNVSVIESGLQEDLQQIELSAAVLGTSTALIDEILETVLHFIETATDAVVLTSTREIR